MANVRPMTAREIHIHIHLDGLAELAGETPTVRVSRANGSGAKKRTGSTKEPASSVIRAWAKEVGMVVPKTGRPNRELVAAYKDAHGLS